MLNPDDREKIASLYRSRLGKDLSDFKVVGWGSKESQELRFQILSEMRGFSEASSIVDIGCGLGDLHSYLANNGFKINTYTGADICDELLAKARQRFSATNANFVTGDIDDLPEELTADFFVMSGALNVRISDNWREAERILKSMYRRCKRGVAVNFLSSYVDYSMEKDFHYEPERMLSLCLGITKRAVLRHDYPLYEFSAYLYKEL